MRALNILFLCYVVCRILLFRIKFARFTIWKYACHLFQLFQLMFPLTRNTFLPALLSTDLVCTITLFKPLLCPQNFYKSEVNRAEMYQRYIYKLHDLHVSAENYVEAALTLRLHADQLEWSTRVLHADLRYPAHCEWQRKEQLLQQMLAYLDRGKCWELGVPLLKELAQQYETRLFDYGKLSETLRTMAGFYDHMLTQLRPEPEYFRVGFYGQHFPLFVRVRLPRTTLPAVCPGKASTDNTSRCLSG